MGFLVVSGKVSFFFVFLINNFHFHHRAWFFVLCNLFFKALFSLMKKKEESKMGMFGNFLNIIRQGEKEI